MKVRAMWHGQVLAESRRTVRVEGNHYFPVADLDMEFLVESTTVTVCPWKGQASYYDVVVDGAVNRDAAWYYPRPSSAAGRIAGHVAFWHGVRVETVPETPESVRNPVRDPARDSLPVWRIGVVSGLTGILCCVGPTVLALLGVVSAGTAFAWATDLYDGYAWWFRLGGLALLCVLVVVALRRRNVCSVGGVRRLKWRIAAALAVAVGTYAALYGVTTWLGSLAD